MVADQRLFTDILMVSRMEPEPAPAGAQTDEDFERAEEALRADKDLRHPRLQEAASFLAADSSNLAEDILEQHLKSHPQDVQALHLMAEVMLQNKRPDRAEDLLAQCVELAPNSATARFGYAKVLLQMNKAEAAHKQADELLKVDPRNPVFRRFEVVLLDWMGEFEAAMTCCRGLLTDYPNRADVWVRYGHSLRSLGLQDDCIAAYRKGVELCPTHGGAYWSLANLKTFCFSDDEVAKMESHLARTDLVADDRTCMHFALGKAYADRKLYKRSFENYAKGNAIYRLSITDNPDVLTEHVAACRALFTEEFFRERESFGCDSRDPIFIVGMPRAGSTLVEQILASHSAIEGIKELPNLMLIGRHLEDRVAPIHGTDYPGVLARLDADALGALGEQYLQSTRLFRKLGRPYFTDKMGSNYVHINMIHLILPNARIIDVRRHPMACCFSNFTQHFSKPQTYTYRQTDLGRSYTDYVDLMAHFDRVLPGKIHRVFYERLVADPETEVRRLLAYLELPFEESCLEFHKNERVVTTVSSEQVRRPIFRDGLEQWRHYEEWLGPLKASLGPVLDSYPDVPELYLRRA